jgi:hypothetical protein
MLLESVQLLYTAHNILKTKNMPDNSYKSVSFNHPIAIWVRTSKENYIFTVTLAIELSKEYTHRYNKIHKCDQHLSWLSENIPNFVKVNYLDSTTISYSKIIEEQGMTPFPLAMPDKCKCLDTIISYRKYYRTKLFAKWTKRPQPWWFYFKGILDI